MASAFVGREPEMALLRAALSRARAGAGSTFLISGEAGIGKSRLARELVREASNAGSQIGTGRGYEGPWSPPLTPWAEALGPLIDPADLDDDLARALAPLSPALRDRGGPASDDQLSAGQEWFRTFDAANRYLAQLSRRSPVVLVLDDIQWADQASLELLRHLAWFVNRMAVLLLVLERTGEAERSAGVSDTIAALRLDGGAQTIALGGLDHSEVAALVGTGSAFNGQFVTSLAEQTSGNPFFIEEMVRNVVADVDSAPRVHSGEIQVPEGVRLVIERRLHRLSDPTRAALRQAAIFPNGFDFPVLRQLLEVSEDELLDAIDEAMAVHLIELVSTERERYDFVHAIVRQSLAADWNPSRRVRLHRKAAEAIRTVYADRPGDVAAEVAVQYHRSASMLGAGEGFAFAVRAADQFQQVNALHQVVDFLRIARDLGTGAPVEERARVLGRLAVVEAETVRIDEALATLDQYLHAAAEADIAGLERAESLNAVARSLKYSASAEERIWRPVVERGLKLTTPEDGPIWAQLTLLLDPVEPLSRSRIRVGRWLGFDPRAVAILRSSDNEDDIARSVESFDAATRAETDDYLTRVRGWSSPTAVMYGLTVAANHLQYRHGAFRDARRLWSELIELSRRTGAIHWEQQATNQLTYLLIAEGQFTEAAEYEAQSIDLANRLGPGQNPAGHQLEMATCRAMYQGTDWTAIAIEWRAMLDDPALGPHDLSTLTGALYGGLAAFCLAQADDHDGARRTLAVLVPILEQMTPLDCNHNGAVALATGAAWRIGDAHHAPALRRLLLALDESGVGDYPQTSTLLALAQAAAAMDRREEAINALARARIRVVETGQAPLEPVVDLTEADVRLRWADPQQYPEIQRLAGVAEEGFTRFGMTPWSLDLQVLLDTAAAKFGRGPQLPGNITEREADVLRLIARGMSDRQISDELFVSPRTVNAHVRNMLSKANAANRVELAMWARANGIVAG